MPKVQQGSHRSTLRKLSQKPTLRRKPTRPTKSTLRRKPTQPAWRKRRVLRRFSSTHKLLAIIASVGICAGFIAILASTIISNHQPTIPTTDNLQGQPTITANFINQVLTYYHSPASGKGQALYDDGVKYNIDPAYALAFFMYESHLGTEGVATVTHSLGNIRATSGYPDYQGYRKYETWEEGFEDWYQLIDNLYVHQLGLTTLEQIIPVYAPNDDNNNEQQYIASVKYIVKTWRGGTIAIA
jgi:Mannosyl-glycoprotein endo-beta-N-acetylglucosaminidase